MIICNYMGSYQVWVINKLDLSPNTLQSFRDMDKESENYSQSAAV